MVFTPPPPPPPTYLLPQSNPLYPSVLTTPTLNLTANSTHKTLEERWELGSPLVVELAEIRVADVENTALTTYKDPPNTYRHLVDDGIGDFRDKSHADRFLNYLNSLTDDLQYTIEYPSHD